MSILIYGDPHGEWRLVLAAAAAEVPDAVVILGDCDLVHPLRAELTPVSAAGVEVAYLYGNHERTCRRFGITWSATTPTACCTPRFGG